MADKINSELNKICNEEFVPHFVGIKDEDLKMNKYQIGGIARNLKKDFVYIVDGGYKGLAGKVDLVSSFTEIDVEDLLSDSTDYFNSNSIVGSNKELYEKYTQKKKEKVEVEEKLQYLEQIVYFLEKGHTCTNKMLEVAKELAEKRGIKNINSEEPYPNKIKPPSLYLQIFLARTQLEKAFYP